MQQVEGNKLICRLRLTCVLPPLTYSTTGSAHLMPSMILDTDTAIKTVQPLWVIYLSNRSIYNIYRSVNLLGGNATHFDMRHAVVHGDKRLLPQQAEHARDDRTGSQRAAHAWSLRVADAVDVRVRHPRLLQGLCIGQVHIIVAKPQDIR